jgi:hypothetical protein
MTKEADDEEEAVFTREPITEEDQRASGATPTQPSFDVCVAGAAHAYCTSESLFPGGRP